MYLEKSNILKFEIEGVLTTVWRYEKTSFLAKLHEIISTPSIMNKSLFRVVSKSIFLCLTGFIEKSTNICDTPYYKIYFIMYLIILV